MEQIINNKKRFELKNVLLLSLFILSTCSLLANAFLINHLDDIDLEAQHFIDQENYYQQQLYRKCSNE